MSRGFVVAFAAAVATVGAALWARGALPPYDDAFFFVRYARNVLATGVPAWNAVDGALHGNTSQLWQWLAVPAAALAPDHVVASLRLVSAAALLGAVGVARSPSASWLLLGPIGLATVTTGMETALVLLLGAWFVRALDDGTRDAALGLGAALLVTARPDAGILGVGSLIVARRGRALAVAAALVVGYAALLAAVYGDPLPTAFRTKLALNDVVDPTFLARSAEAKLRHAALFALAAAPLAASAVRERRWATLAPALGFILFQLAAVVDVMGMHARFFAPCVPWLAAAAPGRPPVAAVGATLAGGALAVAYGLVPGDAGWAIGQVPLPVYAGAAAALLLWSSGRGAHLGWPLAVGVAVGGPAPGSPWRTDADHVAAYAADVTSFRGLAPLLRCVGPAAHVAHSEIGVVGMVFRDGVVTDLGGLMARDLPTDRLDAWCRQARPDAIWLPHRNYRARVAALTEGTCLDGYVLRVARGSSPLYVRADHAARCEEGPWSR